MKRMMLERMKGIGLSVLAAAAFCVALSNMSAGAQATDAGKCGKYYTYTAQGGLFVQRTASGAAKEIVAPTKNYHVDSCVMDSSTIYYATTNESGSKTRIYRIKTDGTGKKRLIELTGTNTVLQGICGNSLVYTYESSKGDERVHTRRYSLKNNRTYKVRNSFAGMQISGGQVIGMSATDGVEPTSLYTVGGETGDWFRISRSCVAYQVIGSKIYYIECSDSDLEKGVVTAVKSCDRYGDGIRVLAQNIKNVDLDQMIPTDKGLYYTRAERGKVYRYDYSRKIKTALLSDPSDDSYLMDYMGDKIIVQDIDAAGESAFVNTVYSIVPGLSSVVKETELENGFVFYVNGKTYYAEDANTGEVQLGRLSR